MNKLDLTVIILTLNEELHIKRCLDNISPIAKKVIVIDCLSIDRTQDICQEYYNVEVIEHSWPGNQADQFNWAIDNVAIDTTWILRLDADEYLTNGLIEELRTRLPSLPDSISACVFPLGRAFSGKVLKHGIANNVSMIRLFRKGKARYERRMMDEHLRVTEGEICVFKNKFIDDNRLPISKFIEKHNSYSTKEAIVLLDEEYGLSNNSDKELKEGNFAASVANKRNQKSLYAKLPLFHRAFWYFLYRYIFRLGFLDGKEGFEWDFYQGLWYRMLVDSKVYEIKKACGKDKDKMREFIKQKYNISL